MKKNIVLIILTMLMVIIFGNMLLPTVSNAAGAKTVLDISYGPIYFNSDSISGHNSSGTLVTALNSNGYIITGTSDYDSSQPVQINVSSGAHNITLRDVTLYTSYRWQSSAVYVASGATANITLEGENRLYGRGVGMLVPDGANITITGGATDSLTVSAVTGAGIGGRAGEDTTLAFKDCGNVTISGGVINATGGDLAAGIGGGEYGFANKTIHIAGGTVTAATTYTGPGVSVGIGGGYGNTSVVNKIQITGGSINSTFGKRPVNASGQSVYKTIVALPAAAAAAVESLTIKQGATTIPYNITAMNTDVNGKLYFYLPASASQTTATIKLGGTTYQYNGIISANDSNVLKMDQALLSISNVNSAYTFGEAISPMASGGTLSGMVTYKYSGTDAVTGGTITNSSTAPINAGSYTVTATLAGNAYYHDATASANFTINSKSITGFSVYDIANQAYTGTAVVPAVTIKDTAKNITLSAGTDYTVSCPNVNAGAATATITGKGNYTGILTKSFTIVPKDVTVSLTAFPSATTKVGQNVSLTAAITGAVNLPAGTITFKHGSTVIGSDVAITETGGVYSASVIWGSIPYGSYNLTAVYNEVINDNYNVIADGSITGYSVTKHDQTGFSIADGSSYDIADGMISKRYGDTSFMLETSGQLSTGDLTYTSSDAAVASVNTAGTVTLHKSGIVTLTAVSPSDDMYSTATAAVVLKVGKADQSAFSIAGGSSYEIVEDTISKTYGDTAFTLEVSGRLSTGDLTYTSSENSVASVSTSGTVTMHKSGTATLTVQSATDECYNPATASVTLEVGRATLSSFEIIASADYTMTEGTISKTYGDAPFTLAVNTSVGPIDYASGDTSIAAVSNDGTVTVLKSGTVILSAESLETDCYNASTATVTLQVSKAAQSSFSIIDGLDYDITEDLISKTYGDAAFTLETSDKLSAGDTIYASSNTDIASVNSSGAVTLHKSGTVTLSALSSTDDRYSAAMATVMLKIGKADQDGFAIVDGKAYKIADGVIGKTYGDAPFALEVAGKLSSSPVLYSVDSGNDVASVDASSGEVTLFKSGTAVVRAVSPTDERYNAASAEVTIRVARSEQSGFAFAVDSITKTYGDTSFIVPISGGDSTGEVTYEVTSGQDVVFVNRTSGNITLLKAGMATVTATKAADLKFNEIDAVIHIEVEKAVPPTVVFPFAGSITYGQKLSDSVLSFGRGDGTFAWETPDTAPKTGSGSYRVIFTPNDTDNYDYTDIMLHQMVSVIVKKAAQTPLQIIGIPDSLTFGDAPFQLSIRGGSGEGVLSYAITSGNAVSVSENGTMSILKAGTAVLMVTKASDDNYDAAMATSEIYVGRTASVVEKTPSASFSPFVPPAATALPSQTAIPSQPATDSSPIPSTSTMTLNPLSIQADESTGAMVVIISIDDLPDGTTGILLPSGEIVQVDMTQNTFELSLSKEHFNEDGELVVTALDKENTPLGNYQLDLSDDAWQAGSADSGDDTISVLVWIAVAGILVVGGAAGAIAVFLNKRK